MKLRKKLGVLLLTGALCMSAAASAYAEEGRATAPTIGTGTEETSASAVVTKNLVFAEGMKVPGATFKFTAKPQTEGAPAATIADITYSDTDDAGTLTERKYNVAKTGGITFGDFPHAGEYVYTVKETKETVDGFTYDTSEYTMKVIVANKTGDTGVYVQSITAAKNDVKEDQLLFTNMYRKNASLSITKETKGTHANLDKKFTFKITIYKAVTESADVTTYTGKIGGTPVTCTVGQATEFILKNGQTLSFDNLPVGTRYKVEEVGAADGYTPSVTLVENGTITINNKTAQTESEGMVAVADGTQNALAGEGDNKVTFTNTYNEIAITGVIVKNMPFILMIGFGVIALVSLAVLTKRRRVQK